MPVMTLMNIPFIMALGSAGILLAIVIVLEAYVLWRYPPLPLPEAIKLSVMANVYSTFIGACIAFAYSAGMFALFGSAIGAHWFTSMFVDLSEKTGKFTWLAERRKICFALFLFGGFGVLALGIAMMPGHGMNYAYEHLPPKQIKRFKGTRCFFGNPFSSFFRFSLNLHLGRLRHSAEDINEQR